MEVRQLVGRNCRRLRLAAGLNQEEFAEAAGIDQPLLSRIEAGSRNITIETLAHIAKGLGCRPADLLAEEDETPPTS